MGEMCDFEAEFYPENWLPPVRTRRKKKTKTVKASLNKEQYDKYSALGGAVWLKKMIASADAPSNAPYEGPGGFSPGPLDAVVGPQG